MRIRMKPYLSNNFSAKKHTKASFGSQNKSLEWNDYSVGIAIHLFGRDLFLGIAIPLFGRDLFLGIAIPWNIYSLMKRNSYSSYFFRGIDIPDGIDNILKSKKKNIFFFNFSN
jgi:hypothetical protein